MLSPTTPAKRAELVVRCPPAHTSLPLVQRGSAFASCLSGPPRCSRVLRPANLQTARSCLLSPRLQPLRRLHDCWDSYPAGTTSAGAGLSPAGTTDPSRRTWTPTPHPRRLGRGPARCRRFGGSLLPAPFGTSPVPQPEPWPVDPAPARRTGHGDFLHPALPADSVRRVMRLSRWPHCTRRPGSWSTGPSPRRPPWRSTRSSDAHLAVSGGAPWLFVASRYASRSTSSFHTCV
jgi:hypothetical protein